MTQELAKTRDAGSEEMAETAYRKPNYMVESEDNAYRLIVHLPGVEKNASRITLDGNLITVEAEAPKAAAEEWKVFRREIPEGSYRLSLELNVDVEEEGISAKAEDGTLVVTLPLAAKAAKRTIAIE